MYSLELNVTETTVRVQLQLNPYHSFNSCFRGYEGTIDNYFKALSYFVYLFQTYYSNSLFELKLIIRTYTKD
jgi:hypothetical protein